MGSVIGSARRASGGAGGLPWARTSPGPAVHVAAGSGAGRSGLPPAPGIGARARRWRRARSRISWGMSTGGIAEAVAVGRAGPRRGAARAPAQRLEDRGRPGPCRASPGRAAGRTRCVEDVAVLVEDVEGLLVGRGAGASWSPGRPTAAVVLGVVAGVARCRGRGRARSCRRRGVTAPRRSVMPYWVTMARARPVAFSMSLPAPGGRVVEDQRLGGPAAEHVGEACRASRSGSGSSCPRSGRTIV